MVFVFVPPHHHDEPSDPRKVRHDTTVGMLVAALVMLVIAVLVFALGPRGNSPPPLMIGVAVLGLALIFGLISFFSWMREQGDGNEPEQDNNSQEEQ